MQGSWSFLGAVDNSGKAEAVAEGGEVQAHRAHDNSRTGPFEARFLR